MAAKKKNKIEKPIVEFKTADDYANESMYNNVDVNGNPLGLNTANEIVKIIETIFSEDNIDQKSFLAVPQIEGLIEIDSMIAYDISTYGFVDRVQYSVAKDTVVKAKNINGWGMEKLVQLFQPIYQQAKENERIQTGIKMIQ